MKITDKESALKAIRAKGFEPLAFDENYRIGPLQFCGWRLVFSAEDDDLIMYGGEEVVPLSKVLLLGDPWESVVELIDLLPDLNTCDRAKLDANVNAAIAQYEPPQRIEVPQ